MPEFAMPHQHDAAAEPTLSGAKRLCPYCRSDYVGRSHRRGPVERYLLRVIGVGVYRCENCDGRFYALSHMHAAPASKDQAA
jgi:hypothetical protein